MDQSTFTNPQFQTGHVYSQPKDPSTTDRRKQDKSLAGVTEGFPGIIESSNIEPLDPEDATSKMRPPSNATPGAAGMFSAAVNMAKGAAQTAYGTITGNQEAKEAGQEALYGPK